MTFDLYPLRLELRALDTIRFPAGKAGNVWRGALGLVLPANLFAPKAAGGPSGFHEPPRPFVLRVASLDGRTVRPGERLEIGINIFDPRRETVVTFIHALQAIGAKGIGPGRGRAEVLVARIPELLRLSLAPDHAVGAIRVRFLTPTELKSAGEVSASPEFSTLFARARDRISSLRAFYGPGPLDVDFSAMGKRAGAVLLKRLAIRTADTGRKSSRTGQEHPIGGFTGEVEYEGDLTEFVPFLRAIAYTGVGRHTVWGNGEIEVEEIK